MENVGLLLNCVNETISEEAAKQEAIEMLIQDLEGVITKYKKIHGGNVKVIQFNQQNPLGLTYEI